LFGYLTGEKMRPSEFGSATAVHKETMVSETIELASQQHETVSALQINFGSPSVETYSTNNNYSSLNHRMEMERYLVECIEHHQRLIGCIICECTEYNCFTFIGNFLKLYSPLRRFSEKLNLLWHTAYFVQFLTAFVLICFIGITAISVNTNKSIYNKLFEKFIKIVSDYYRISYDTASGFYVKYA
jgi:hypothetical protein